jgi:hypothetical protein
MEVMTTERSGDGGVDVRAMDQTQFVAGSFLGDLARSSLAVWLSLPTSWT